MKKKKETAFIPVEKKVLRRKSISTNMENNPIKSGVEKDRKKNSTIGGIF
jgi:hypothetical protein